MDIATSTIVAKKLGKMLKEKGFKNVELRTCKVNQILITAKAFHPDVVVFTGQIPSKLDVPAFVGTPFISGIGMKKTFDEIVEALKKKG